MQIRPIHPQPILFVQTISDIDKKEERFLVISDLHIGIESQLDFKGISFNHTEVVDEMIQILKENCRSHQTDRIILLGDIKSSLNIISKQEWDRIPYFLKEISKFSEVYLIPGNHDGNIRFLIPDNINVITSRGMIVEDTLFVHGHVLPSQSRSSIKRIIMGHLHPIFYKKDSVLNGQRVWIYLKSKKNILFPSTDEWLDIIVIPSFNKYLYTINPRSYRKSISPIIKRISEGNSISDAMVLTLDGSIVGEIETAKSLII